MSVGALNAYVGAPKTSAIAVDTQDIAAVRELLDVDAGELAELVARQPLLLDREHVEEVLAELARLMRLRPDAAAANLRRDPGVMLRVERGQRRLGVNPDEM